MFKYTVPTTDDENPFYCPSVSALSFLENLRQRIHSAQLHHTNPDNPPQVQQRDSFPSFEKLLDQSIGEDDLLELLYRPACLQDSDSPEQQNSSINSIFSIPPWERKHRNPASLNSLANRADIGERGSASASHTFSDLLGTTRRERSFPVANEVSFDLSGKADRICYFPPGTAHSPYGFKARCLASADEKDLVTELNDKIRELEGTFASHPLSSEGYTDTHVMTG